MSSVCESKIQTLRKVTAKVTANLEITAGLGREALSFCVAFLLDEVSYWGLGPQLA
jgi:hypothetical protein